MGQCTHSKKLECLVSKINFEGCVCGAEKECHRMIEWWFVLRPISRIWHAETKIKGRKKTANKKTQSCSWLFAVGQSNNGFMTKSQVNQEAAGAGAERKEESDDDDVTPNHPYENRPDHDKWKQILKYCLQKHQGQPDCSFDCAKINILCLHFIDDSCFILTLCFFLPCPPIP